MCAEKPMSRAVAVFNESRLLRIFGKVGMIAAAVFAVGGPAAAEVYEVRSGNAVLKVDGATGALVWFADTAGGLGLDSGGQELLFRLVVIPPGTDPQHPLGLTSRDAETVKRLDGDGLRLRFERIGHRDLAAVCVVEAVANGLFRFRIKVEGESGTIVERIDYPLLRLATPIGGDPADDELVTGTAKGGVLRNPLQVKPGKFFMGGPQPGSLAAQFACYYDPKGGMLTYCEDSAGYPKVLSPERTKTGVLLSWRHPGWHDLKEPWSLAFPVVVGGFRPAEGAAAGWRDAADIYKAWALKQPWCAKRLEEREDLPGWLKQGPAQVRFNREWMGQPERIEAWLDTYWAKHFKGVPLIVTFWGWEGLATWAPPQYFPPYPSEDGLKRCVDAVKRVGGHVFFWPSGYQWCLSYGKREDGSFEWEDRALFEREAKPHAIIRKDGKVMLTNPRWYHGGEAATLCRGDKWSRDWLTGIAVELAKRGGELFQIDQVVGAGMRGNGDCHATTHGHPPGIGMWDVEAAHRQMAELRAACRAAGVNMVLGFEEPQERFLQEVGLSDYRDYEVVIREANRLPGYRAESVFGYLYHEFAPLFQSNPVADNREMTAHCMVTGQMPHLVPHWPLEPHVFPAFGGFDEWVDDVPAGWQHVQGWKEWKYSGRPWRDPAIRHSGASSLRLESSTAGEITEVSRNLPIGPSGLLAGRTYRFSVWCRTERLAKPAAIGIIVPNQKMKSRGSWKLPFPEPGDWREVSVDVVVPAEPAEVVRVMIRAEGPCRIWVDDFRVAELDAQGTAMPIMRDGLPSQHQLYKQWVDLYHGVGRPYLQFGTAIAPPLVEPAESLYVGAFRAPDGSEAVIVVNAANETRQATFRRRGKSARVKLAASEARLLKL